MSTLSNFYGAGAAGGGGGLSWGFYDSNQTTIAGKGYFVDNSTAAHTITLHSSPVIGDTVAIGDLKGSFATNNLTVARNSMKIQGQNEDMILDVKNQRLTLVYSGTTDGWIITELEPNNSQYEYMPYAVMHVQDQKPVGTASGSASAGTTIIRTLNTVLKNDISGASLAGNQVTLPAGTYWFDSLAWFGPNSAGKLMLYNSTTGTMILNGVSSGSGGESRVNGELTFPTQTVVDLRYWSNQSESLGYTLNISTVVEVYLDLKITKIGDNYVAKPVLREARLQPMSGVVTDCQVSGFEITNTGANQLTVLKGQCMDSTQTRGIAVTVSTVLTLDTTVNKLFTIAAVVLNNGTQTCKVYDSEAAMAADVGVNITYFAYIGWWQNNGSGVAKTGKLFGIGGGQAELMWGKASECAVTSKVATPANCSTAVSLASFLPSSDRVSGVLLGTQSVTAANYVVFGIDGTNSISPTISSYASTGDTDVNSWYAAASATPLYIPINNNTVYWGDGSITNTGTADIRLHSTRFRR